MNIAFFITPKEDVVYLTPSSTMRQALESMEHHRYTSIPLIDENGFYIGTLTEGDLLWKMKNTPDLNFQNTNKILLSQIERHVYNKAVYINANIEDLILTSINQNFVPVVDDRNAFIGIVKRSDIISYCYNLLSLSVEKV